MIHILRRKCKGFLAILCVAALFSQTLFGNVAFASEEAIPPPEESNVIPEEIPAESDSQYPEPSGETAQTSPDPSGQPDTEDMDSEGTAGGGDITTPVPSGESQPTDSPEEPLPSEEPTEEPLPEDGQVSVYEYQNSQILVTATVTTESGPAFPEEPEFVVSEVQNEAAQQDALEAVTATLEDNQIILDYTVYDISFLVGGVETEPSNAQVQVEFTYLEPQSVPQDGTGESAMPKVFHVEDGQAADTNAQLTENEQGSITNAVFTTTSFSPFVSAFLGTAPTKDLFEQSGGVYSFEYPLQNYNVFVKNDFTGIKWSSGHTVGAIAVGGNVKLGAWGGVTQGPQYSHHVPSFVGGNIEVSTNAGRTAGQKLYYGGTATVPGKGNELVNVTDFSTAALDMNKAFQAIEAGVAVWAQKEATDEIQGSGWEAKASLGEIYKANSLDNIKSITFSENNVEEVSEKLTVFIVNGSGTQTMPQQFYKNVVAGKSDINADYQYRKEGCKLLWIFPNAEKVTLPSTSYAGHIIAPKAYVTIGGGNWNGAIVAKSLNSNATELHYWPYIPGEDVVKLGSIELTKNIVNTQNPQSSEIDTFYFALFNDSNGANQAGEIKQLKLSLKNGSSGKVLFDNLKPGDYYVFETDSQGKPVDSSYKYKVSDSGQMVTVAGNVTGEASITNTLEKEPLGSIELTKTIANFQNPESSETDTFYFALFTDSSGAKIASDIKALELSLKNGSSGKVLFDNLDPGAYYVFETNAQGIPVNSSFRYKVSNSGQMVTAGENVTGEASITNTLEKEPLGSIELTKTIANFQNPDSSEEDTFYFALFNDPSGTKIASEIKPLVLSLKNGSSGKVFFDNLNPGAYYVFETNSQGIPVNSSFRYQVSYIDSSVSIMGNQKANVQIINSLEEELGSIELTKNIVNTQNPESSETDTFYFGLFTDSSGTEQADEIKSLVLSLKNGSSDKLLFDGLEPGEYYVFETDSLGKPVSSTFKYQVQNSGCKVTINGNGIVQVSITNSLKGEEPTPPPINPTPAPINPAPPNVNPTPPSVNPTPTPSSRIPSPPAEISVPEVEIDLDEEIPLAPVTSIFVDEDEEEVDLDEDIPTGPGEPEIELDEEIPLGTLPQTGTHTPIVYYGTGCLLMLLGSLFLLFFKRKNNEL